MHKYLLAIVALLFSFSLLESTPNANGWIIVLVLIAVPVALFGIFFFSLLNHIMQIGLMLIAFSGVIYITAKWFISLITGVTQVNESFNSVLLTILTVISAGLLLIGFITFNVGIVRAIIKWFKTGEFLEQPKNHI